MRTIHDLKDNVASRNAEDAHRSRRLDRDALIAAALDRLEASAYDHGATYENTPVWISAYVQGRDAARYIHPEDIRALLAEIRAQLSPVVK